MYTHAYAHENTCACMTLSTRWSTDTKTHNLWTNMHTHTHTHVYKRIDVQIHTHMHICSHIMSAHIHTYAYIHTRIQDVHMNARKARLKRRRGCAGSQLDTKKLCPSPCPHHNSVPSRPHPLIRVVRSQSTQFIFHASSQLGHGPPKRGHFSAILAGFCSWTTWDPELLFVCLCVSHHTAGPTKPLRTHTNGPGKQCTGTHNIYR